MSQGYEPDGYLLVAPTFSRVTALIDRDGQVVNTWESDYLPGLAAELLENGHLLRVGRTETPPRIHGGGGIIEEYDWDGDLVWSFRLDDARHLLHHDIEVLPNGNILCIALETLDPVEAAKAGRSADALSYRDLHVDSVIEIEKTGAQGGRVVWQWRVMDHIVQSEDPRKPNYGDPALYPGRIDFNYIQSGLLRDGFTHANSVEYNAEEDLILLSVRNFSEVWVIDHSTTTLEAATNAGGDRGHGGDLLFRWGNPEAYGHGDASSRILYGQHDAEWVEEEGLGLDGILVYNNGVGRPDGTYSSVLEIALPTSGNGSYLLNPDGTYAVLPVWGYAAPERESFYSQFMSGAQRLPDGATLITEGDDGRLFEVDAMGEVLWEYRIDVGLIDGKPAHAPDSVFDAKWYPEDYPGLAGRLDLALARGE